MANDFPMMDVVGTVTVNDNAMLDWSSGVPGIALRGGDRAFSFRMAGWSRASQELGLDGCCQGPGLILGADRYFGVLAQAPPSTT